jgi:hypothetical protein
LDKLAYLEVYVMLNHQRLKNIVQTHRTKARVAHQAKLATTHRSDNSCSQSGNVNNWYQHRKRASLRIGQITSNQVVLVESGYRGHHRAHLVQASCHHVFLISLHDLAFENFREACPFCFPVHDLNRYGSVAAVQEYVAERSNHKISFADTNILSARDSLYSFGCELHGFLFDASFEAFVDCVDDSQFCPVCAFG